MLATAKEIQFAKMAGLTLSWDDGGHLEWTGTADMFREFQTMQAKDDRGEYYNGYPWQDIQF